MASPLDPAGQSQLESIDQQIAQMIKSAQSGTQNPNDLSQLESQIQSLAKNKKIPENVRDNLKQVLNDLKNAPPGQMDIFGLYSAKMQIDAMLSPNVQQKISNISPPQT